MVRILPTTAALALSLTILARPDPAAAQALEVSDEQLQAVLAACVDPGSETCAATLAAFVAAYPDLPPAAVIGALASELAAASNAAIASGGTGGLASLATALSGLSAFASSVGLGSLASTIATVASAVQSGQPVDVGAIASGAVDGAPDIPASPA